MIVCVDGAGLVGEKAAGWCRVWGHPAFGPRVSPLGCVGFGGGETMRVRIGARMAVMA